MEFNQLDKGREEEVLPQSSLIIKNVLKIQLYIVCLFVCKFKCSSLVLVGNPFSPCSLNTVSWLLAVAGLVLVQGALRS